MIWVIVIGAALVAVRFGWPVGVGCLVVAWLVHSWLFPWTACPVCKGSPRHTDGSGRNYNVWCPACRSRGRRRRIGSKLLRRGFGHL